MRTHRNCGLHAQLRAAQACLTIMLHPTWWLAGRADRRCAPDPCLAPRHLGSRHGGQDLRDQPF
eukprot:3578514-Pyramimonas_sp.AAC.1